MKVKHVVALAVLAVALMPVVTYACAECGCRGEDKHSHDDAEQVAEEAKACPLDCTKACCVDKQEKQVEPDSVKLCEHCGEAKGSEECYK